MTPAVLAPFVPAATLAQLAGLVSGTLTLDADRPVLAAVRGQLVLDRADLSVAGVAFNQQQPTRVDVADGRARVAAWNWGGGVGNTFSVGGSVTFDGTPALDVSLDGTIDLRALGAFLPQVTTGGQATLTARVTGAPAAPQLNGRIDLQRGELRMASPRLVVSDLTGSLLLSQDEVTVQDVEGQANGGTLWVAGALKHSGLSLTSGRLAITGRDLAMADSGGAQDRSRSRSDARGRSGALSLSGDATVLGGAYREPISLATRLPAGVAVVAHDDSARRALGRRRDGARRSPDDGRGHRRRQQLRAAGAGRRRADPGNARGADSAGPGRSPRRRTHLSRRQRLSDRRQRRDRFFQSHAHRARPADHAR